MAQRVFQQSYHVPGTLTANITISFIAPFDCTLLHASACASNDSDATLIIGDSDDTDEYLQELVIGDSGVPAEYDGDDFRDTGGLQHTRYYPRIADGTVVIATLDYDGDGGTAADDYTLVMTFAEG